MKEYEKSGGEAAICKLFIEKNAKYFEVNKDNHLKLKAKLINKGFSYETADRIIKNKEN